MAPLLRTEFHGREGMMAGLSGQLVTWHPQAGSRKRQMLALGLLFSFSWSEVWPHGVVPPTLMTGPLSSVNPFWRHRHRHIQECVSMVILKPVKLMMKGGHHWMVLDSGSCFTHFTHAAETHSTANT